MKKKHLTGMVAALLMFGVVSNSAANSILLNGSFESPAIPENSYQYDTPTSWTWSSSTGFIFNGSVFNPEHGSNWPSPFDGQQYVDIGNVSTFPLSQSFTVTGGGTYQLAWYDNAHSDVDTSPYSVSVIGSLLQTVASENFDAAHGGVWQGRTLLLNLAPDTYTLTFTALGHHQGYDTLLDNVTTSPVPVPAAVWLLGSGIAGLVGIRSKRKKQ